MDLKNSPPINRWPYASAVYYMMGGEKAHDCSRGMHRPHRLRSPHGEVLGALRASHSPSDAARPHPCRDNRTISEASAGASKVSPSAVARGYRRKTSRYLRLRRRSPEARSKRRGRSSRGEEERPLGRVGTSSVWEPETPNATACRAALAVGIPRLQSWEDVNLYHSWMILSKCRSSTLHSCGIVPWSIAGECRFPSRSPRSVV